MITKKLYQINIEKYKPGKIGKYFISSKAGNFSRASAYFDKKEKERLEKLDINEFNSECKKMIDDNIKNIKEYKLPGGLSDNFTLEDLSKKHNVSIDYLKKQLELGIKVESEHTPDKEVQREIAMNHLSEKPNYYEKLKLVEKKTMKVSEAIKLIEAKTGKKVVLKERITNNDIDYSKYRKLGNIPITKWSKFMSNFNFDVTEMDRISKHLGYNKFEDLIVNDITPLKVKKDSAKFKKLKTAIRAIRTTTRDMSEGGIDMLVEKKLLKEVKVPRQKLFDNPSHYVEKGANIEYFFKKETISGIIKSPYQENEKKTVWVIVDGDTTRTELKYIKKIKDYEFV